MLATLTPQHQTTAINEKLSFLWNPIEQSLHKYCLVRKSVYFERRGWTYDFSLPDQYDRCSQILVVMDGNKCIGGARLTVKSDIGSMLLPTESEHFRFDAIFPDLNLHDTEYAEVSRQVLLPEYRGGSTVSLLDKCIVERCKHLGVPFVFAALPLDNAARTKKAYSKLIQKVTIHKDIYVPSSSMYDNCKLYLSVFEDLSFVKPAATIVRTVLDASHEVDKSTQKHED